MAVQALRISVGNASPAYLGTIVADDQSICVKNMGTTTLAIGGADVTFAAGYPLLGGEAFAADLLKTADDKLFAIAASGDTSSVAVLRTGA